MDDPIHNNRSAAKYLRCSESLLNKLRCTGGGPIFIKIGASVAYRQSALDTWTRERSFRSTTEADALRPAKAKTAKSNSIEGLATQLVLPNPPEDAVQAGELATA